MIGSLITKKCTKALITAPTSQINGGKAMTPGLSSVVTGHCLFFFLSLVRERTEVRVIRISDHWSLFLLNDSAARTFFLRSPV